MRQKQSAKTRQNIIDAGVRLSQENPDWDWKNLTFKAIGKSAGVSERTVYRHFESERNLKDAIMQQLVDNAGVDLNSLKVADFNQAIAAMFKFLGSISHAVEEENNPTFISIEAERRLSLLQAVASEKNMWDPEEQENIAALLDILWHVPTYERLTKHWRFDNERAIKVTAWLVSLIQQAMQNDSRPQ